MRNLFFYTLLCAVFVGAETARALTDSWSVDVQQHAAVQRTYKQGESHDLRIQLRDGLRPASLTNAAAAFYWYTNATANIWWTNAAAVSASGLVTASWTPAMDTGAASYPYWIGIWPAGSTSPLWRVTGTIRLLPSPGFTPNTLVPPVRTIDFGAVTMTNAPWVTAADWASGSNALAAALQALPTTQQVSAAAAGIASALATQRVERVWSPDATEYRDGTGGVWRIYDSGSATGWVAVIPDIPAEIVMSGLAFPVASVWEGSDWDWSMTIEATGYPNVYDASFSYLGFGSWSSVVTSTVLPMLLQPYDGSGATQPITLEWRGAVTTQHVATVALDTSLTGLASRAELAHYVTGTVLTQATSHVMAQFYDDSGCVTQQILRVGDSIVTNRWGPYVTLPSGLVTNGYAGVLTFGSRVKITDWYAKFECANGAEFNTEGLYLASGGGFSYWDSSVGQRRWGLYSVSGSGDFAFPNGSLAVAGTNTAAVLRSQSSIILPHYGTNTLVSLIFTNGTIQAWEIAQ